MDPLVCARKISADSGARRSMVTDETARQTESATAQDYVKAAVMIRKPLMTTIGGGNMPATAAAMKAARIAVGNVGSMVNIALGAIDKALVELKATGQMTAAAKGALGRETAEKVEQVAELNARSRKYNLPSASAPER